jgi:hypothetical protein
MKYYIAILFAIFNFRMVVEHWTGDHKIKGSNPTSAQHKKKTAGKKHKIEIIFLSLFT